ncbi:MAG TPA: PLD nuclease N-terminal domain-containing protein [Phycisphaerae bacterium]|nr:PLD nuclease N-terminal domain-containing protein [Phycisphaerae bacterium]
MPKGLWESLSGIPPAGLIALGLLACLQLVLQVLALVDLVRREREPQPAKWVWCIIVILGGLIGAIVYWAVGRRTAPTAHIPLRSEEAGARSNRAMDLLYGQKKQS